MNTRGDYIWMDKEMALAVHNRQLAEHGGDAGIRDEGLLESALAKPQQLLAYGDPEPDLAALAASLGFGIARNHPFVDGNKRTATVLCEAFIVINGSSLLADNEGVLGAFLALAEGSLSEDELAQWVRLHLRSAGASVHETVARYG